MKQLKTICLSLAMLGSSTLLWAQNGNLKGIVVDDQGEPIIGASIVQKGSGKGAVSDLDGNFSVTAQPGTTLVISYVGFLPQEVKAKPGMRITLHEDTKTLSDVVVIGYGTQKKSVVTASIASIGADQLKETAPVRVDNALKGLVSGVQVTIASGQPGAGSKIRVRGTGSYNNSDPLYIVDGMPVSGIDYLNPSDIQSIEVLKDAASGAVYGTRAANGVVLVTTKTGQKGKARVTYDFSCGWQNPWRERKMLDAQQYATLMQEAADYAGTRLPAGLIPDNVASLGKGTDWLHETFNHNAPIVQHQVSVSGASDRVNYYLSLGYVNQEGIVGGNFNRSNYERTTLRSNTTYTLWDEGKQRNWLSDAKIGVNAQYSRILSHSLNTQNLTGGSPLSSAMFLPPTMTVYPVDESALLEQYKNENEKYGLIRDKSGRLYNIPSDALNEINNPLAFMSLPGTRYNTDKLVGNFFFDMNIWDHLRFKSTFGVDLAWWGSDGWNETYYLNKNMKNDITSAYAGMDRSRTWQLENTLTYDRTFGEHTINVVLGQSALCSSGRSLSGEGRGLVAQDPSHAAGNIDFITGNEWSVDRNVTGSNYAHHKLASYFGRLSYNYAERYILQLTVRRDGSSRFGPSHKWATFPSASLGWNITNEKWMEHRPDWLANAKLRLSWGKNGNENIGDFLYTTNVSMGNNYGFGSEGKEVVTPGSKPSGTANADLKWEESEQYDAGLDLSFFDSALTFTVDWFKKKTNGMIKQMSVPSYLGESKPYGNVGDMQNTGMEFELGYKFHSGDWNFSLSGNASYVKNKLIKYGNASGYETFDNVHQVGNVSRGSEGEVYPYFYGYKTAGIFQNEAEVKAWVNDRGEMLQPNAKPGDVRFVDYDHNGVINADDRTKIGKGTPDWTYDINFTANWRDIDFSMLWTGVTGNQIFEATRRLDCPYVNLPEEFMSRWHGEGTSNGMPRFTFTNDNDNWRASDLWIHSGTYLRLKNIQLGYTLPEQLTRRFFISRLRLFVAAENLLTITPYDGFEPEISADTSNGIDRGYYPQARTITVGLNVAF